MIQFKEIVFIRLLSTFFDKTTHKSNEISYNMRKDSLKIYNDGMGGLMFCSTCGHLISDHDKLCCVCSQRIQRKLSNHKQTGFFSNNSRQANDGQLFNGLSTSRLFAVGLSLLLLIGFGLYGGVSSKISFLDAISIPGLVETFFIGFTFLNEFKIDHHYSWNGVVLDKRQMTKDKY